MGEYADDYFRKEVKSMFGVDPGSMYSAKKKQKIEKVPCKTCGKRVKPTGIQDHMRDAHKIIEAKNEQ